MAIDMRNMLTGFSSQLISADSSEIDFGGGGAAANTVAACVLRSEDLLDVGFVVTEALTGAGTTAAINIGKDANEDYFVDAFSLTGASAKGTVFRVSDGTLSWASTANTEALRSMALGTTVTFKADAPSSGSTGKIVPFVIMRPQGPLDPIA